MANTDKWKGFAWGKFERGLIFLLRSYTNYLCADPNRIVERLKPACGDQRMASHPQPEENASVAQGYRCGPPLGS